MKDLTNPKFWWMILLYVMGLTFIELSPESTLLNFFGNVIGMIIILSTAYNDQSANPK